MFLRDSRARRYPSAMCRVIVFRFLPVRRATSAMLYLLLRLISMAGWGFAVFDILFKCGAVAAVEGVYCVGTLLAGGVGVHRTTKGISARSLLLFCIASTRAGVLSNSMILPSK